MASHFTDTFLTASQKTQIDEIAKLDQYYELEALTANNDENIGGGRMVKTSAHSKTNQHEQDKKHRNLLRAITEQQQILDQIDAAMVAKYGEDFAEQFAADLLDEQPYKKVMSIQDQKERREAIAEAINDGIATGTIDQQKAYENPDFGNWLDKSSELSDMRQRHETALVMADNEANEIMLAKDQSQETAFDNLFSVQPNEP
ncbi:hypothetical protein AB835_09800 [Candidatus Endobugula sertula]|uniref:Uncharacterized protein n=1 Tax=Candidatus Endobugula sertula TaxID=62101 RepID=A0A1D2QNS5_9GAMM|nr:hypothetical protein AB835_09800 [Candidatus Endobugula sertula]